MAQGSRALPHVVPFRPFKKFVQLLPGVLLLAAVGYLGKFVEQSISAYAKARHLHIPNIEYVLWAILFGLIIGNTIDLPKIFEAGIGSYEFFLKAGIVLLGSRFLLGDVAKLGGIQSGIGCRRAGAVDCFHVGAGTHVPVESQADEFTCDRIVHLRRVSHHRRAGRDRGG